MYNFVAPFLFSIPHVLHIFFSSFLSTFPPFLFPSFLTFPPLGMPHHNNGSSNGDNHVGQWISICKGKEPRQETVGPIPDG